MKFFRLFLYVSQCMILISVYFSFQSTPSVAQINISQPSQDKQNVNSGLEWNKLNQFSEQALYLIREKDFLGTRKAVSNIEEVLLQLELGQFVDRLDQANLITDTVVQAKYLLNRLEPDPGQIERQIIKMRLMLDAVSHQQQPLWLSIYPTMSKIIQDLRYSLEQNKRDTFYQKLNELYSTYELVRPALFVSHKQGVVEQLDSQIAFFTKDKAERWKDKKQTMKVLDSYENQIKFAFFQKMNQSMQSFIYLLIGITSIICLVLGYVAWRKYKGEHEVKTISWTSRNID